MALLGQTELLGNGRHANHEQVARGRDGRRAAALPADRGLPFAAPVYVVAAGREVMEKRIEKGGGEREREERITQSQGELVP